MHLGDIINGHYIRLKKRISAVSRNSKKSVRALEDLSLDPFLLGMEEIIGKDPYWSGIPIGSCESVKPKNANRSETFPSD